MYNEMFGKMFYIIKFMIIIMITPFRNKTSFDSVSLSAPIVHRFWQIL